MVITSLPPGVRNTVHVLETPFPRGLSPSLSRWCPLVARRSRDSPVSLSSSLCGSRSLCEVRGSGDGVLYGFDLLDLFVWHARPIPEKDSCFLSGTFLCRSMVLKRQLDEALTG